LPKKITVHSFVSRLNAIGLYINITVLKNAVRRWARTDIAIR